MGFVVSFRSQFIIAAAVKCPDNSAGRVAGDAVMSFGVSESTFQI